MTATNGGPGQQPQQQQTGPQLSVLGQYIKDFSFENPNAPRSLAPKETQPSINIQINVGVGQLAPTDFEVSLKLEGKAELEGTVLFAFDLTFAGIFRIDVDMAGGAVSHPPPIAGSIHELVGHSGIMEALSRIS